MLYPIGTILLRVPTIDLDCSYALLRITGREHDYLTYELVITSGEDWRIAGSVHKSHTEILILPSLLELLDYIL